MRAKLIAMALVLCLAGAVMAETLTNSPFALEAKGSDRGETSMGNLVADALRSATGADLALVNASQLRPVNLPAGPITEEQVDSVLAYPDDPTAIVLLKGSKVAACLERGVGMVPQPNKGFLQVSGISVRFDSGKPAGARVVSIRVGAAALDPDRVYRVAMPGSLARGSGGYFSVLNGATVQTQRALVGAAVNGYLREHGTASARASTPRIQDVSAEVE